VERGREKNQENGKKPEFKAITMMKENWILGFLGFMGFLGINGLITGNLEQAIWIVWFVWFIYFIPEKK